MADLDQEEYGAVRETVVRTNSKSSRSLMVAGAIAVTMAAALALLANNVETKNGHIEEMVGRVVASPDVQLEGLVNSFVKEGNTMSLAEMEKKLDSWRHNPSTILDLNEGQRMQACSASLAVWYLITPDSAEYRHWLVWQRGHKKCPWL